MSRKIRNLLVSFAFLILLASSILFYLYIRGFALNTLGIKSFKENKLDAAEREIATALISQKNIDTVWKLFIEGINLEMQKREKKLNKIGVNTDSSVDDSLLVAFNKKINDCETFNDVENLLLLYTTAKGCDFINGFLRGDMSTVKSKNTKIKSSWGTDLHVSFNILLDSAIKALELRKILMYGDLKDTIQVYRGLNMMGFFKFINFKDSDSILFKSQDNDRDTMRKMVINYLNYEKPIYSTKAITSTSTDKNIAIGHAYRTPYPVLMDISLTPGISFGKDFSKTSFGTDDYNKEVILKPEQKIQICDARIDKSLIIATCKTVQ